MAKIVKKAKVGIKKAKDGNETPFQKYVKKYPGSGSDTLRTPLERSINRDDFDWNKKSKKQKSDLSEGFKKTYSNYDSKSGGFKDEDGDVRSSIKSGVRKNKTGGKTKKAKSGAKMTKAKYGAKKSAKKK